MISRDDISKPPIIFTTTIVVLWALYDKFVEGKQPLKFNLICLGTAIFLALLVSLIVWMIKRKSKVLIVGHIGDDFSSQFEERNKETFWRMMQLLSIVVIGGAVASTLIWFLMSFYQDPSGNTAQVVNAKARACGVDEIKLQWQTNTPSESLIAYDEGGQKSCISSNFTTTHEWILNRNDCQNSHFPAGTEGTHFPVDKKIKVKVTSRSLEGKAVIHEFDVQTIREACLCANSFPRVKSNHPTCETYSCLTGINLETGKDGIVNDLFLSRDPSDPEKIYLEAPNGMLVLANTRICDIDKVTSEGMIKKYLYFANNSFQTTEKSTSILARGQGGRFYKISIRSHTPSRMASKGLGSMVGIRIDWIGSSADGTFKN